MSIFFSTGILLFVASVIWCKTAFSFHCSKDFLRITYAMGKRLDYCGNKTGQNLLVTGDKLEMTFRSDDNIEKRGYYLVFTLVSPHSVSPSLVSQASVSPPSALPHGKWDHKEADYKAQFRRRTFHETNLIP